MSNLRVSGDLTNQSLLSCSFGDIQVSNITSCRSAYLIGSPGRRPHPVSEGHQVQKCQAPILGECLPQVSFESVDIPAEKKLICTLRMNVKLGGINLIPDPQSVSVLTDPHYPTVVMGES